MKKVFVYLVCAAMFLVFVAANVNVANKSDDRSKDFLADSALLAHRADSMLAAFLAGYPLLANAPDSVYLAFLTDSILLASVTDSLTLSNIEKFRDTNEQPGAWRFTGNNTHYFGGNVGIGTITPSKRLQVIGDTHLSGKVGIGINADNPGTNLHVIGCAYVNNTSILGEQAFSVLGHNYGWNGLYRTNGTASTIRMGGGNIDFRTAPNGTANASITSTIRMRITNDGFVGIGTDDPQTRLHVAGSIRANGMVRANEVKVTVNGADFVFEPDYYLRPLAEVEQFIIENKHLPEIAPAVAMEQDGVNMGEFQMQLLQKIEELTLYVIELKKENEAQQKEINELKKQ